MIKTLRLACAGFIIPALLLLLFVGTIHAQTCAWKVSGASNTVYLIGSIHLLKADDLPPPAVMEQAFADADVVVLETSLDSLQSPEMQQFTMMKALYPEGKSLATELSDSTLHLTRESAVGLGLNIHRLLGFKPWFVAVTMNVLKLQQMGFNSAFGIDHYFHTKARQQGKTILGLESVRFQLGLFSELESGDQEEFLLQSLREFEEVETMLDSILQAWKKGNLAGIDNLLNKHFKPHPDLYDLFLVRRNHHWMTRIETFLGDDKNYLIIVGAGHLAGEEGLIRLLEQRGFTLRQL